MNRSVHDGKLGFVFPGQGSQSVGMMKALSEEFDCVAERYATASDVLGFDLWKLVADGPEQALNSTRNTQPALLAASVATWDVWLACGGPRPSLMAGHSFGEYTALVCAGALDYASAIALVADRGRFMQEAVPDGEGAMAAILGLDFDTVTAACAQASQEVGLSACANLNAPGQIVIAGSKAGVARACELAKAAGAKRAMLLPVSVPAHCELMQPAASRLASRLDEIDLGSPDTAIIHNVDVREHAVATEIRDALVHQLYAPVRWVETIEYFATAGITTLCECGPGKVLSALVKRIDRNLECHSLADGATIRELIQNLTGQAA